MTKINSPADLVNFKNQVQSEHKQKQTSNFPEQLVQVRVGMATCGIASGARETMKYFEEELEQQAIDAVVSQTGCLGLCYAEPTVEVILPGQEPVVYGYVDKKKAEEIIDFHIKQGKAVDGIIPGSYQTIEDLDAESDKKQVRIALRNCGVIDPEEVKDYIGLEGYQALAKCLTQFTPQEVINEIKESGLRGRGGGGFSTGLKWEITHQVESDQKYVVCNADEGDPGAFMDRSILEGDPHSVLEAMAICGYCIGADTGLIYIRAEYPLAIERLKIAIKQAEEYGLIGNDILGTGFNFKIELRYGAGAFVCGEETALIHSMEGLRGEPTFKPPFPSVSGYMGKPTNVNNVETFASVPVIVNKGASWFGKIGTEKSKGTKVFALAGKINNVGLIEVPMGTTLREVIYDIGGGIKDGKKFKAVQTGGPSGGCLTSEFLDTPIDYDNLIAAGSMMGSGGMIVMDEDDCMVSIAKFYLEFTLEESCGKCTPCRIGNKRLFEILETITEGKGSEEDIEKLKGLSEVIKDTSLCGLGQSSPNPVLSTLANFENEYEAHVKEGTCPAGQCKSLLRYDIVEDLCTGCTLCFRNCPVGAITGERRAPHYIDQSLCIKCGVCFEKCKFDAITLT